MVKDIDKNIGKCLIKVCCLINVWLIVSFEKFLEVVVVVLVDIGFEKLIFNVICVCVGLILFVFYYYFNDKYEVLEELVDCLVCR